MELRATMSNHETSGTFGWFNPERKLWCLGIFMALAIGYSFGNGHTTQGAIASIADARGQTQVQLQTQKGVTAAVIRNVKAHGDLDDIPKPLLKAAAPPPKPKA